MLRAAILLMQAGQVVISVTQQSLLGFADGSTNF